MLLADSLNRGVEGLVPPCEVIGPWAFFSAIDAVDGGSVCREFATFVWDRLYPTCPLVRLLAAAKKGGELSVPTAKVKPDALANGEDAVADDVPIDAPVADPAAWAEGFLGGPVASAAADVFGVGAGLQAAGSAVGDVITELQSFTKFRDRIDALLRDLREGPAGPKQVGQDAVTRANFGGGSGSWLEATNLFGSYETVISELEKLSKLLTDSIEGMSIAVLASHKGYENVDADVRQRMLAISDDTTEHYGGSYEPSAPGGPGGTTTKPGGTSGSGDTSGASGF